jgi:hypothetical protein
MSKHVIALVIAAVVAVGLFLKHKAIAAFTGALWNKSTEWFWRFVYRKIQTVAPPAPAAAEPSNLNTYRGLFDGYGQYSNHPAEHFFTLVDGETIIKVPVLKTNLLTSVQKRELVEIDTQTGACLGAEVVLRVRINPKSNAPPRASTPRTGGGPQSWME